VAYKLSFTRVGYLFSQKTQDRIMKKIRLLFKTFIILILVFIVLCIYSYFSIKKSSSPFIYDRIENIPYNKTGLLLGTSKYTRKGMPNPYFYNRIAAAIVLYKSEKIKYLILSGDNRYKSYNEPIMMKKELIRRGIPDSVIFLDFAGFRTYDSVIRCKKVFEQNNITIISQRFHLERAIYIANKFGINAIGYEAYPVGFPDNLIIFAREFLARIVVLVDIYTQRQPKFLGNKIIIPE